MLYERIVSAAVSTPWAITPAKLQIIESFLARKSRGETIPDAEIQAAKSQQRRAPTPPGGVGLVPVYGTITQRTDIMTEWSGGTSTEQAGQRLDALAADPNVKAIVLDVDSPGGSVYGVAELGDKIRAIAKDKKVIGVVNSEAASAAYWLIAQCSEVVVTPSGQVGSIGVFHMHMDCSEALAQAGRKPTVIKAGAKKNAAHPYFPLDTDGREEMQKSVDDYYAMFVRAVATGRNVSQTKVRQEFGQGSMVRAQEAVSVGMADTIGTLESVLARYGLSMADVSPAASRESSYASADAKSMDVEIRRRRAKLDATDKAIFYDNRRVLALTPRRKPATVTSCPTRNNAAWETALHESGHAVAAVLMGVPFASISMSMTDYSGALNWRDYEDPKRAHDEAVAVLLWAGPVSESLNELPRPSRRNGDDADRRVMSLRCPDEAKQRRALETAKALVANHAPTVRLVAAKLLAAPDCELSSELVEAYCREAGSC